MSVHTSVLHQLYEQHDIVRFRAFLSPSGTAGSASRKGKEPASSAGVGSYGASGSLSRSPRFGGYFSEMHSSHGPSKDEINARDRLGRTVLHIVASDVATFPVDAEPDAVTSLDYLEALLKSPHINVNLQDKESGWTALHRAVYAGNLIAARRLLQHNDVSTTLRDSEGLSAYDLLNSTLLGTNPMDLLDNVPKAEQEAPRRELVTWGANRNFVLGLQGDSERTFAERVPLERVIPTYRKAGEAKLYEEAYSHISVEKIAMEKLHSGLLTNEPRGNIRLCGFGSTTGRLGHSSSHPQFAFEPLKGFESQRVVDFALGQDHTILCTQEGNVYTFGLNTFSVLGYPVENALGGKPSEVDEVQATPKRLFGIFKKEHVRGVAASRYHSVAFTEDALFTWGRNNGQLGYSSGATPMQSTPRKATAIDKPVKQVAATEVATVCLLESGEVVALHRDVSFKISFPMTRLPAAMQAYRPPGLAERPSVTKIDGSGTTFIAITTMGDLFSWQLDNPSLETPTTMPSNYGREIRPQRVWEERKTFTACTDAAIANDTIIISTRSGHVFVSARRKELASVKGVDLRSGPPNASSASRRISHKFSKVAHLQRVTQVAVSSSGGFAAIRRDAPLMPVPRAGLSLSGSLQEILPHYCRLGDADRFKSSMPTPEMAANQKDTDAEAGEDEDDEDIESDIAICDNLCRIIAQWDFTWALPSHGSDVLIVFPGSNNIKIPAHSVILVARSPVLRRLIAQGQLSRNLSYSTIGTNTLHLPQAQPITVFLLLHFIYTDSLPALFDGRVLRRIQVMHSGLRLQVDEIKAELLNLAILLELTSLTEALKAFGKTAPQPTLLHDIGRLLQESISPDVVLESSTKPLPCHGTILRATCPFFEAMFSDPDWYTERIEGATESTEPGEPGEPGEPLHIDLTHLSTEILELILEDMYADTARLRMQSKAYDKPDDKLAFALAVMAVANELLLDRLKTICAEVIRPFVNLNTVCSLLCEAVFYESDSLQKCCMQYIACNIETMFEQRLLDVLPSSALDKLARFCRQRQLDRLSRTKRSGPALEALEKKYADFIKELDLPKPTGGYKRHAKSYGHFAKSPKLSPAHFTSSLRLSPGLSSSPVPVLSPPLRSPASPALSATSGPSPSVRPALGDDGDTFDIDDLDLDSSAPSVPQPTHTFGSQAAPHLSTRPANPASVLPWRQRGASTGPATSLKDIMAQEGLPRPQAAFPGASMSRRVSSGHPTTGAPVSPSLVQRLSQRERKRQAPLISQPASSEKTPAASPWRPILPGTWKPPETDTDRASPAVKPQASQFPAPGSSPSVDRASVGQGRPSPVPLPAHTGRIVPTRVHGPTNTSASPSSTPGQTVHASGAPVITPTRLQPKRNVSAGNRVPDTRSHDTPWVNYTSTVFVAPTEASQTASSFATIQNLQSTERDALQKQRGPMSLKEIQEEEDALRREAEFLTWFEEESKRAQNESGTSVRTSRGGTRTRGARGNAPKRGGRDGASTPVSVAGQGPAQPTNKGKGKGQQKV